MQAGSGDQQEQSAPGPELNEKVTKGLNWTKAILHCLACTDSQSCGFANCLDVKSLLLHLVSSTNRGCQAEAARRRETGANPGPSTHATVCPASLACSPVRQLIAHWLRCQDPTCVLCVTLWADILRMSGFSSGEHLKENFQVAREQQQAAIAGGNALCGRSEPASSPSPMQSDSNKEEAMPTSSSQSCSCAEGCKSHNQPPKGTSQPENRQASSNPNPNSKASIKPADEAAQARTVIHFLEVLLQCFIQKTPVEQTQPDQIAWLFQGKELWHHMMMDCGVVTGPCPYPGCQNARCILRHRVACKDSMCPLCLPLKEFFGRPQQGLNRKMPEVMDLASALGSLSL